MDPAETIAKLITLGLNEQRAKETLKNNNLTKTLLLALKHCEKIKLPEGTGLLIYHMCTKIKAQIIEHLPLLTDLIIQKKLDNQVRIDVALEYLLSKGVTTKVVDVPALEKACGVGVVVTPEEIDRSVEGVVGKHKQDLVAQRYRFPIGKILAEVRALLPWADGKAVKAEVDVQIFDLLGPKNEADLAPVVKEKKPKEKKEDSAGGLKEEDSKDSAGSIAELMKNKVLCF